MSLHAARKWTSRGPCCKQTRFVHDRQQTNKLTGKTEWWEKWRQLMTNWCPVLLLHWMTLRVQAACSHQHRSVTCMPPLHQWCAWTTWETANTPVVYLALPALLDTSTMCKFQVTVGAYHWQTSDPQHQWWHSIAHKLYLGTQLYNDYNLSDSARQHKFHQLNITSESSAKKANDWAWYKLVLFFLGVGNKFVDLGSNVRVAHQEECTLV